MSGLIKSGRRYLFALPGRRSRRLLLILVLGLLVFASGPVPAGSSGLPPFQSQTDTNILNDEVSTVFVLPAPIFGGEGSLRSPLIVFYEPGAQEVAPAGSRVGFVVSAGDAGAIDVIQCPDSDQNLSSAAIKAACLAPAGLDNVGTYEGAANLLLPPDTAVAAESDPPPDGEVAVSLIVQQPWPIFAVVAALGILLSLFATWYVGEYQQIRRLREACVPYASGDEPIPCPEDGRQGEATLQMTDLQKTFATQEVALLNQNGFALFFQSLLGRRPDYEKLNESLTDARVITADFATLCRLYDTLEDDNLAIDVLFEKIGGSGSAAISEKIQDRLNYDDGDIAAAQIATRLDEWRALHELAQRWYNFAVHVDTLCGRLQQFPGLSCTESESGDELFDQFGDFSNAASKKQTELENEDWDPDSKESELVRRLGAMGNEVTVFIANARGKLAVLDEAADFAVLRPEVDIQEAWLVLEKLERVQMAMTQAGVSFFVEGEAKGIFDVATLPDFAELGEVARGLLRTWSPKLNAAMIVILLVVSYAATLLLGAQTLYIDQPWGSGSDIVFLLLLGGGVYAGLTGIAGAFAKGTAT